MQPVISSVILINCSLTFHDFLSFVPAFCSLLVLWTCSHFKIHVRVAFGEFNSDILKLLWTPNLFWPPGHHLKLFWSLAHSGKIDGLVYLLSREFLTHLPAIHYNISTCNSRFLDCYSPIFLGTAELADLSMNHCFCIVQPSSASTHTGHAADGLSITCCIKDYSHK